MDKLGVVPGMLIMRLPIGRLLMGRPGVDPMPIPTPRGVGRESPMPRPIPGVMGAMGGRMLPRFTLTPMPARLAAAAAAAAAAGFARLC